MFEARSRYRDAGSYTVTDRRGRSVSVVAVPAAPAQQPLGIHRRLEGQRLDHLAQKYLGDPAGFWRICEQNDVMWPDALAEVDEIAIPRKA